MAASALGAQGQKKASMKRERSWEAEKKGNNFLKPCKSPSTRRKDFEVPIRRVEYWTRKFKASVKAKVGKGSARSKVKSSGYDE